MLTKAHIKFINELRQKKSARDEHDMFVAEGPKLVSELLAADNVAADEVFATEEWLYQNYDLAQSRSRFMMEITERELERISGLTTPNKVVAIFRKPTYQVAVNYHASLTLMLDGIQDPGNLGTIIRIADWFGISNIVCSPTCADAFGPKVVQSTMGSVTRVRVEYANLVDVLLKNRSTPAYVAALEGTSIYELAPVKEGFLLIGNEARGVSEELLRNADYRISVPRVGEAESLNAAVATGIILSHIAVGRPR